MKQKVNVFDGEKRRVGVLDVPTQQVKTSDGKERPLTFFQKLGVVNFFNTRHKGKPIK